MKFGKEKMGMAKRKLIQVLTWGAALLLAIPALPQSTGQSQEPSQGQGPVIKSEVTLVNLFATVRDKNHRVVTDLKQEDFHVQEDGHDEKIAFFSKEMALPITLGLLLDTSGSEQFMLGAIQDAGGRFMHRVLKKGDEAMVISFDSDVDLLSDFTDDKSILDRAINKARVNIPGGGSLAGNPGPVLGIRPVQLCMTPSIWLARKS